MYNIALDLYSKFFYTWVCIKVLGSVIKVVLYIGFYKTT